MQMFKVKEIMKILFYKKEKQVLREMRRVYRHKKREEDS